MIQTCLLTSNRGIQQIISTAVPAPYRTVSKRTGTRLYASVGGIGRKEGGNRTPTVDPLPPRSQTRFYLALLSGGFFENDSTMSLTQQQLEDAVGRWPDDDAHLPAHVQAVFQAWRTLRVREAMTASAASPLSLPAGTMTKDRRCRYLTLSQTPFPVSTPSPPALLTAQQVRSFRTDTGGSPLHDESPDSQAETIRQLQAQLRDQQSAIERLLIQQESLAEDTPGHSSYPIAEATLQRLPKSLRNLVPMSRVDRRKLRREHSGLFPKDALPRDLQIPEDIRREKAVATAKLGFLAVTKDIIQPVMDANTDSLKMAATVHSRLEELRAEMSEASNSSPDATVLASDILEEVLVILGTTEGTLDMVLDTHARLRTAVTSRLEKLMGFDNLHPDPNKRAKESFLSDDFDRMIEERAKSKAHRAWARSQHQGSNPSRGSLHEDPPPKNLGGGGATKPWRTKRASGGRGRGSGGRGRGIGRGRGSNNDRPSSARE